MTPAALATLHARAFTTPRPWSEAEFASLLTDPLAFLLVEGDVGFLLGRAVAGEAELLTIAVAAESRRLGLGRKLVGRFIYQARLRGSDRAFLEVAEDNAAARGLYHASGFSQAGRRRGYYRTPDGRAVDALVLARSLQEGASLAPT